VDYAAQTYTLAQAIDERNAQAFALTTTGHGLAGLERWDTAADTYHKSCDLYRAIGRPDLAAEPLAGLARLALAQEDTAQAMAYVEPILLQIESRHVEGAEEPLRIDLTCYQVLRAANDPRADAVLERAHIRLQEQAAKISDEAMQNSFLHNVPYHREIVAAWTEVVGEDH
jgi:hypothetical protein